MTEENNQNLQKKGNEQDSWQRNRQPAIQDSKGIRFEEWTMGNEKGKKLYGASGSSGRDRSFRKKI